MGEYEAADGKRETVELTPYEVETLVNDDDVVTIDTESEGEVELYSFGGDHHNYNNTGANSRIWDKLLSGEKDELTWRHIPLRVVMVEDGNDETFVDPNEPIQNHPDFKAFNLDDTTDRMHEVAELLTEEIREQHDVSAADDVHVTTVDLDVSEKRFVVGATVMESDVMDVEAAAEYFQEHVPPRAHSVITSEMEGVDLYVACQDAQDAIDNMDMPNGWRATVREYSGINFIKVE